MKHLVIIGGGFAGLWAALSARRFVRLHQLEGQVGITLINKDAYHGLRPRFYESDLSGTRILLKDYLAPCGIQLCIATVERIEALEQKILLNGGKSTTVSLIFQALSFLLSA